MTVDGPIPKSMPVARHVLRLRPNQWTLRRRVVQLAKTGEERRLPDFCL